MKPDSLKHSSVAIDAVLQDSYLLVVELRQGASARSSNQLWLLCVEQVDAVRQSLKDHGLAQRSIDHISHAQCALLDETVLTCAEGDTHSYWSSTPLQARFFNSHHAGESLYEDMREVLREPAPDLQVLTVFLRVLMLGFHGRYRDGTDPEREQLLAALTEHVGPLQLNHRITTGAASRQPVRGLSGWRSPWVHGVAAMLMVVGVWWGLNHLLGGMIAPLLSGQA